MRHLDLFSGIGGFALAASWVWGEAHEIVAFCEIEEYPQRVLRKHWPDVPIVADIHDMDGRDYDAVDLVTGGFPCQPFSQAGKRRGSEDDRALWPQMYRVICEARPRWVVAENVLGLLSLNGGLEFDQVLSDLEAAGYTHLPLVLPAAGVDAPHRRDRVWIVGYAERPERWKGEPGGHEPDRPDAGRPKAPSRFGASGADGGAAPLADPAGGGWGQRNAHRGRTPQGAGAPAERSGSANGGHVAHAHEPRSQGHRRLCQRAGQRTARPSSPAESRLWLPEPDVGRVANGIPRRVDRLRGLGNAIVPQVAAQIFQVIKMMEDAA